MRKFWIIWDIIGLGWLVWVGLFASVLAIDAAFRGGEYILAFNDYHEGIIEAVLFSLGALMGLVSVVRHIDALRKSKEVHYDQQNRT